MAITEPGSNSYESSIVQALTTHIFGVGNSGFRIGAEEGERDTVPYGFFDKAIFTEVGMFNELLERAQDYELNSRINENGGLVWFNPKIQFSYNNQASLLNFYKKQFFFEAPYNAYMWWINLSTFNIRHSITALFVLGIFFGAILSSFSALIKTAFLSVIFVYFLLSIYSSVVQAIRYSLIKHIFFLPFCFFFFHFIHGTGILYGCFNLLSKNSPVQRKNIF